MEYPSGIGMPMARQIGRSEMMAAAACMMLGDTGIGGRHWVGESRQLPPQGKPSAPRAKKDKRKRAQASKRRNR